MGIALSELCAEALLTIYSLPFISTNASLCSSTTIGSEIWRTIKPQVRLTGEKSFPDLFRCENISFAVNETCLFCSVGDNCVFYQASMVS